MAINHTFKVQRIEVYPAQDDSSQPRLMIVEEHLFDDPDDDQLPVTSSKVYHLTENDDVSGKIQFIQDVYNSVITYTPPVEEEEVEVTE